MVTPRPRPVWEAAIDSTKLSSGIAALVTAILMAGLITQVQANAITIALGGIATIVAAVAPAVSALRTATTSEPQVTPLSSPQSADGTPLVPAVPTASTAAQTATQSAAGSPQTAADEVPGMAGPPATEGGGA